LPSPKSKRYLVMLPSASDERAAEKFTFPLRLMFEGEASRRAIGGREKTVRLVVQMSEDSPSSTLRMSV
jgi:hypothetical protein